VSDTTLVNNVALPRRNVGDVLAFLCQRFSVQKQYEWGMDESLEIADLQIDSRRLSRHDLFIAVEGETHHGLHFLEKALEAKAAMIICDRPLTEEEGATLNGGTGIVPVVVVIEQFNQGEFASWFYHHPSRRLKVVGITGTNGKTSTAFFTAQLLEGQGQKVAMIGTLGNGRIHALQPTLNTTPNAVDLQRLMHQFYMAGLDWVVMEVSSHALSLGRVQGVEFQTVALTQVTRDHMDFHGTEAHYRASKMRLFTEYKAVNKVVNLDDSLGQEITNQKDGRLWGYSLLGVDRHCKCRCVHTKDVQLGVSGIEACFVLPEHSEDRVFIPLMGLFNLENILCSMSILLVNGFEWSLVKQDLPRIDTVTGRMQILNKTPAVIVDFAHTPDALEQVLLAVKQHLSHSRGRLRVVFGCGGDRDKGKRPLMGEIAERLADTVVLTSDNPRTESPHAIVEGIMKGMAEPNRAESNTAETKKVSVTLDRALAIRQTLDQAQLNDVVVIAGKGHEAYQEVMGVKYPYSDIEVIKQWSSSHKFNAQLD